MKMAEEAFVEGQYSYALNLYKTLVDKNPEKEEYTYLLSQCYLKTYQPQNALRLLEDLNNSDLASTRDYYHHLANAHFQLEQFNKAKKLVGLGLVYPQKKEDINHLKKQIELAKTAYGAEKGVQVQKVAGNVNSAYNEHSLILTKDHETIMYTSSKPVDNDGEVSESIYKVTLDSDDNFGKPIKVKGVKSNSHDATVQLFKNDTKAVVYRDGDLYTAERVNGAWVNFQPIDHINTLDQESHCFINETEDLIVFTSRGYEDSNGDLNLYYTKKEGEKWSKVQPIKDLNTPYDEDAPFIAEDGTLYFSSQGHNSIGGFDIFKTNFNSVTGKSSKPMNLGYPINSVADDTYYVTYGKLAYLSSSRKGGVGMLDIYRAYLFDKVKIIGKVEKKDGTAFPNAVVRLESPMGVSEVMTNTDGLYEVLAPAKEKFSIIIKKAGEVLQENRYHTSLKLTPKQKKQNTSPFVIRIGEQQSSEEASSSSNPININLTNDFNFNPLLGDIQGLASLEKNTKSKNIAQQPVNLVVTVKAKVYDDHHRPVAGVKIIIDAEVYETDESGEFLFYEGKNLVVPKLIEVEDRTKEIASWSLFNNELRIEVRPRYLQYLRGVVVSDKNTPVKKRKVLIVGKEGVFHESITNAKGEFDFYFSEATNISNQMKILVEGFHLNNFTFTQNNSQELFLTISASPKEIRRDLPSKVVDESGKAIANAFVLLDGKYYKTNEEGIFVAVVGTKKDNYIPSVDIHHRIITNLSIDSEKHLLVTVETIRELDSREKISQIIPEFVSKEQATEQLIEEQLSGMKKQLASVTETMSIDDLGAYKSQLDTLKRILAYNKMALENSNSNWSSLVSELEMAIIEREDALNQAMEDKFVLTEEFKRKLLMYSVAIVVLICIVLLLTFFINKIRKQKTEIEEVKNDLDDALLEVKRQNGQITDSLRYAQTIQTAILASDEVLASAFDDHFVLYRPKDIVSGDFYWLVLKEEDGKQVCYLTVADCTGHGVPGAFMSMIGRTLLEHIIFSGKFTTDVILEQLNQKVIDLLQQKEVKITDGMDMTLCRIEPLDENGQVKISYTGAKNGLYVVDNQNRKVSYLRGDRKSIGGIHKRVRTFTSEEVILNKGDMILMTTDGIIDQHDHENSKFGRANLEALMQMYGVDKASAFKEAMEEALDEHQKDLPQRDDIAVVGIKF